MTKLRVDICGQANFLVDFWVDSLWRQNLRNQNDIRRRLHVDSIQNTDGIIMVFGEVEVGLTGDVHVNFGDGWGLLSLIELRSFFLEGASFLGGGGKCRRSSSAHHCTTVSPGNEFSLDMSAITYWRAHARALTWHKRRRICSCLIFHSGTVWMWVSQCCSCISNNLSTKNPFNLEIDPCCVAY